MTPDVHSIAGKAPAPEREVSLMVVGAGPAGVAAATEAARAGVDVLLVDEHPLDVNLMAMDVPLWFGQRMAESVRNRGLMLERVVETNAALAEADAAGVELQLGVAVWGAFRNGPTVRALPGPMVGLGDEAKSSLVGHRRLVVAAGARDLGLAFAGWQKAGVMGAHGLAALLGRYRALATRRVVVLGAGALGLRTAALALEARIEVAGIVEVAADPPGAPAERDALLRRGVPFFPGHTAQAALGATGEVEALRLVRVDADLQPVSGSEIDIACDTVCVAVGLVPSVELLGVLGCPLAFRPGRGGFVPEIDEWMETSLPGVFAAGDCAGLPGGGPGDLGAARAQGRLAGVAAALSLGAFGRDEAEARRRTLAPLARAPVRDDERSAAQTYRTTWLRALVRASGGDVFTCQCEEVTRQELADLAPPRYLGWDSAPMREKSLRGLLADGPVNPDQLKRLTRVGMGPCQGRRCREQTAMLVADLCGIPLHEVPPATYRPPVRPLPLAALWPHDEPPEMREHWVSWFGIPTQFVPHWAPDGMASALEADDGLGADRPSPDATGVTDAGSPSRPSVARPAPTEP